MAAVAVVALTLFGWRMYHTSTAHAERAAAEAHWAMRYRQLSSLQAGVHREDPGPEFLDMVREMEGPEAAHEWATLDGRWKRVLRFRARASHHAALERKYRRLSRSPWLPVDPDPADPQ
jgi:hypothetical protein